MSCDLPSCPAVFNGRRGCGCALLLLIVGMPFIGIFVYYSIKYRDCPHDCPVRTRHTKAVRAFGSLCILVFVLYLILGGI